MDYHLKPVGKTCAATGEELVPGSTCFSVVVERDGKFERLDFSDEGWAGPPEGSIGHWKSVVPEPETDDKPRPLDPDALLWYFEQLVEDANPAQEKLLFVLTLLLLQKRRLRIDGSRWDGETEFLEVVGSRGEGPYAVRNHEIPEDEIEQLQASLNAHLADDWS